jgi:hypothetical protein
MQLFLCLFYINQGSHSELPLHGEGSVVLPPPFCPIHITPQFGPNSRSENLSSEFIPPYCVFWPNHLNRPCIPSSGHLQFIIRVIQSFINMWDVQLEMLR